MWFLNHTCDSIGIVLKMPGDTGIHILYSSRCIIVRTYTGRNFGAILVLILVVLIELTLDGLVSRRLSSTIEN